MSAVIVNPNVDSIFTFYSNAEFERFFQQNQGRYIRWPPTVSGTVIADCRAIENFYRKKKFIPKLMLPPEIVSRIYQFYQLHVYPALPVIINIRNNPERSKFRNTNILEIKKFLQYFEKDKQYKFIIICNKSEIPECLRDLKNVLFSKDYFDGLEQDLALIQTSYLGIFSSSGMSCFAWWSGTPLIEFGPRGYNEKYTCPKKGKTFNFFAAYQRIYHRELSADWLVKAFEDLISYLKENRVNNTIRDQIESKKYTKLIFKNNVPTCL